MTLPSRFHERQTSMQMHYCFLSAGPCVDNASRHEWSFLPMSAPIMTLLSQLGAFLGPQYHMPLFHPAPAIIVGTIHCHELRRSPMTLTHRTSRTIPASALSTMLSLPPHSTRHKNSLHYSRSDLASRFNLSSLLCFSSLVERSINCRKKDLPALTALHAWLSRPISDCSSFFLLQLSSSMPPAASGF